MEDKRIENSYEEVRSLQASIEGLIQFFDQELYNVLHEIFPFVSDLDIPRIVIDKEWLPPFLLTLGQYIDSLNLAQVNLIHLKYNNPQSVSNSGFIKNKISEYLKEKGIHPEDQYDEAID